jgi:hypothetical protein
MLVETAPRYGLANRLPPSWLPLVALSMRFGEHGIESSIGFIMSPRN